MFWGLRQLLFAVVPLTLVRVTGLFRFICPCMFCHISELGAVAMGDCTVVHGVGGGGGGSLHI